MHGTLTCCRTQKGAAPKRRSPLSVFDESNPLRRTEQRQNPLKNNLASRRCLAVLNGYDVDAANQAAGCERTRHVVRTANNSTVQLSNANIVCAFAAKSNNDGTVLGGNGNVACLNISNASETLALEEREEVTPFAQLIIFNRFHRAYDCHLSAINAEERTSVSLPSIELGRSRTLTLNLRESRALEESTVANRN